MVLNGYYYTITHGMSSKWVNNSWHCRKNKENAFKYNNKPCVTTLIVYLTCSCWSFRFEWSLFRFVCLLHLPSLVFSPFLPPLSYRWLSGEEVSRIDGGRNWAVYDDNKCVCREVERLRKGGVQAFAGVLCVCVSLCEFVWVYVMMMMNGGLSPLTLPVSTACKHREIIWADMLSCSLMQL